MYFILCLYPMSSPCCIYPQPRPREAWSLDNESWAGLGATSYPHPWSCWSCAFGAKLCIFWFRRPKIAQVHTPNSMTSRHSVRTSRNYEFAFNTLYIVTLVVNMSTKTPKATACQSVIPDMSVYKNTNHMKTERSETGSWIDIDSTHRRKKTKETPNPALTSNNSSKSLLNFMDFCDEFTKGHTAKFQTNRTQILFEHNLKVFCSYAWNEVIYEDKHSKIFITYRIIQNIS